MSDNRWDQQGIPHKGWNCVDVIDIRADGDARDMRPAWRSAKCAGIIKMACWQLLPCSMSLA